MKVLLLAKNNYLIRNANEICAYNIIDSIPNSDCAVVCFDTTSSFIKQDNKYFYTITHKYSNNHFFSRYLNYFLSIYSKLISLFYKPAMCNDLVKSYFNKANEIIKSDKSEMIISLLHPIESVEAGYRLKKKYPEIKWVVYDIDTLSNCSLGILERLPFLRKQYLKIVKKYEKKIFSTADLIIHFKWHRKHFEGDFYKEFLYKTLFLGIPVLKIKQSLCKANNKDLIYAGRFYRGLREPKILLDSFKIVLDKLSIKLHIYTNNEYANKINETKNIFVHNYIAQEELDKIIDSTGFLVSLGNSYTDMFPSKIITYIATLKPIIHIYQTPNDPVIEFLKDYPDVLLINSKESPEINANKIVNFINSDRPIINAEYIKEIYKDNLPEYNAQQIINYLQNLEK